MADVSEETAFNLIHLKELLVALLQRLPIPVQLIAQREFAKAVLAVEEAAGHDNYAREHQEIEVVFKHPSGLMAGNAPGMDQEGSNVHQDYQADGHETFNESPVEHKADDQQHQVQPGVVRRDRSLPQINHH